MRIRIETTIGLRSPTPPGSGSSAAAWHSEPITLLSVVALGSGRSLRATFASAGRSVAAGGLDSSATAVRTSLRASDLRLTPLNIVPLLVAHAAFAAAARLAGATFATSSGARDTG